MIEILLWVEGFLLLLLLILPTLIFLIFNWNQRRQEILSGVLSEKDEALTDYFNWFHLSFHPEENNVHRRFDLYYNALFGRKHFIIPLVLLFVIGGILIFQCNYWIKEAIDQKKNILDKNEAIAIFAILGAYLWVAVDQITKWWYSDLSHKDLYWGCLRFAMAVPIGYSVTRIMGEGADAALAVAFFIGAFPLNTLLAFFRKVGYQKIGVGEATEERKSELQKLEGIDNPKIERLAAEGITTINQLAYADPIRLTIRTNLGYSYLIDCISQALLRLYTGENQKIWSKLGLRGGFEVTNINSALTEGDDEETAEAETIIAELAASLGISIAGVKNIIWEVTNDPYMVFIYKSWTSAE